jgi:hypothetical protein
MTKKKAKAALATPVTLSTLSAAGIADFKMTKEDLIDLLVEEATTQAEQALSMAAAAWRSADANLSAAKEKRDAVLSAALINDPTVQAFGRLLGVKPDVSYSMLRFSNLTSVYTENFLAYLTGVNEELKQAQTHYDETLKAQNHAGAALRKAEHHLDTVINSSKKLRVSLIKKILANNPQGTLVLDNVKVLASTVLEQLGTKQLPHGGEG